MRLALLLVLLALAAPVRAQWEPVPLPASFVSPGQVALFGFAQGFGDALFVSTGFGIPPNPTLPAYDLVFVTRDGGRTWAAVPEFGGNIGRPTVADGALYLPRTGPGVSTVPKTTDGRAWTVPAGTGLVPTDGVLLNVARQDGVLYGHSPNGDGTNGMGYVYRSADEGATWARVGTLRTPGRIVSAGRALLLSRGGLDAGERSYDGGATWVTHGTQLYTAARSTAGVTLAGALRSVQRSTDGGQTFQPVATSTLFPGGSSVIAACGAAFFASTGQAVVRSTDGGVTWAPWNVGLPGGGVSQLSCSLGGPGSGPAYVYAATSGTGEGVYRRDVSQSTVAGEAAPEASGLDLAVGPNPAARTATLRFVLAEPQTVRVALTDVLGRTVLTLDRPLGAGQQTIPLDVSGLAPGLYVARVATATGAAHRLLTVSR